VFYLFVSSTSYYVEVENGALLHGVMRSWKMIFGGRGKFRGKVCEPWSKLMLLVLVMMMLILVLHT